MGSVCRRALARVVLVGGCWLVLGTGAAFAAVTPGWECVPTAAGQAVVSGGTGSAPSCGAGTTAVLAPTFVSSGVGGKPTVQFAAVNVQVVSGSGSTTGAVNGLGNLIIGYAENASNFSQTGSHDLVVGANNGWKGYGEIVGGQKNQATGNFATVFGTSNVASGGSSFAAGEVNTASGGVSSIGGGAHNTASGSDASVTGGTRNIASSSFASVTGGCSNLAGTGTVSLNSVCNDTTGHNHDFASITGGAGNQATGISSALSGGQFNLASDAFSSISGGCQGVTGTGTAVNGACGSAGYEAISGGESNLATDAFSSITGGCEGTTGGGTAPASFCGSSGYETISGGYDNNASAPASSIGGGEYNKAADEFSFIGGGCDNIAGAGTANTDPCDPGGEGVIGGAEISSTGKDVTSGAISDGVNSGQNGQGKISVNVGANGCVNLSYSIAGAQIGDLANIAYQTQPPAGLTITTTGVTTAGQVNVEACNSTSSAISYDNVPIRVQTFR